MAEHAAARTVPIDAPITLECVALGQIECGVAGLVPRPTRRPAIATTIQNAAIAARPDQA